MSPDSHIKRGTEIHGNWDQPVDMLTCQLKYTRRIAWIVLLTGTYPSCLETRLNRSCFYRSRPVRFQMTSWVKVMTSWVKVSSRQSCFYRSRLVHFSRYSPWRYPQRARLHGQKNFKPQALWRPWSQGRLQEVEQECKGLKVGAVVYQSVYSLSHTEGEQTGLSFGNYIKQSLNMPLQKQWGFKLSTSMVFNGGKVWTGSVDRIQRTKYIENQRTEKMTKGPNMT